MEFKNYGKADTNDGLIPHQDLMGLHEFTDDGNNPIEPFEDATGNFRKRVKKAKAGVKRVAGTPRRIGAGAKKMIANAQANRSKKLDIKNKQAQANVIAAKSAGKTDPAVAALLKQSSASEAPPKSNTGLYIGIGVGVLALAVGAYLVIKKPWK